MNKLYIDKFIENLPEKSKKSGKIDLILDGGLFNGSYLVGAVSFLREMEKRNYIQIDRISGCSIGSVVAFLYYIDALDLIPTLYTIITKEFTTKHSLKTLLKFKILLRNRIPDDICSKVNNRLFICYHNVKCRKKVVKSVYKNVDDILNSIVKSCYVPLLVDNNMIYKGKYIDGINAYIFDKEKDKKILHMELFGYDKFIYALHIKNEKSNEHRILTGLLDIHSFFIKQTNTTMCSYVDEWSLINKFNYKIKTIIELFIVNLLYIGCCMKMYLPTNSNEFLIVKLVSKIVMDSLGIILETYFI